MGVGDATFASVEVEVEDKAGATTVDEGCGASGITATANALATSYVSAWVMLCESGLNVPDGAPAGMPFQLNASRRGGETGAGGKHTRHG